MQWMEENFCFCQVFEMNLVLESMTLTWNKESSSSYLQHTCKHLVVVLRSYTSWLKDCFSRSVIKIKKRWIKSGAVQGGAASCSHTDVQDFIRYDVDAGVCRICCYCFTSTMERKYCGLHLSWLSSHTAVNDVVTGDGSLSEDKTWCWHPCFHPVDG